MTTFPRSPRVHKGGLAVIDPVTAEVERVIALQYNPESLSRSFQVKGAGEGGDRSEALRLTGPAVETLSVEATIDAADQLEVADPTATELGLHPQLAAIGTLIYPESGHLVDNDALASSGTLEISPAETPLTLFIWSQSRIVPVRITELSVTEEAFDAALNPIRAKVKLGMRVLSVDDLPFDHKGGSLYLVYQQQKERLAAARPGDPLSLLGIRRIP